MNVYDKAYELAKAIKDSNEYTAYKTVMREITLDEQAKRMLDEFRGRQLGLQQKLMSGESPTDEEREQMEKLYEVLNINPLLRRMFDAERRIGVIVDDVNRIVMDPLKDMFE